MTPTPRRFYRILHRIADGAVGRLERDFLRAVRVTLDEVNQVGLSMAIVNQDWRMAVEALGINGNLGPTLKQELESDLRAVLTSAGVATAALAPDTIDLSFGDVTNREIGNYARRESSQLVRDVTSKTRQAIRVTLADGIRRGRTVAEIGQDLRKVVGLTRRQAQRIARRRGQLLEGGASAERIEQETARMRRDIIRERAHVIARTETIAAANAGQEALWQAALEEGILDPDVVRKVWVVTPDDRLCPICRAIPSMNPDGRKIGSMFMSPIGWIQKPTAHPRCRCSMALVFSAEDAADFLREATVAMDRILVLEAA